jgi:hypothetical protein
MWAYDRGKSIVLFWDNYVSIPYGNVHRKETERGGTIRRESEWLKEKKVRGRRGGWVIVLIDFSSLKVILAVISPAFALSVCPGGLCFNA